MVRNRKCCSYFRIYSMETIDVFPAAKTLMLACCPTLFEVVKALHDENTYWALHALCNRFAEQTSESK